MSKSQDDYLLQLRPLPNWRLPAEQRLRAALKQLLRAYGLRCISARPAQPDIANAALRAAQATASDLHANH